MKYTIYLSPTIKSQKSFGSLEKEVPEEHLIDNADVSFCISNSQQLTYRQILQNIIHRVILSTLMSNQSFFIFSYSA